MWVGRYWDTISGGGVLRWQGAGWRNNIVVSSAWTLVAALLRNEDGMRGILYCAVGEGDSAWDGGLPTPTPDTARLRKEIARVALGPADIGYIDGSGNSARTPTHRLALTVTVAEARQTRRLREFGLVGGDATRASGSGHLVNYAVHPVIELRPGQTLTRTIRLSFRPGGAAPVPDGADVPLHWLGAEPVTVIDGVGASVAEALRAKRVSNVGQLALLDPTRPVKGLSPARGVELRAKARLALQTAALLAPVPEVDHQTVDEVLSGTAGVSGSPVALERLRDQLGVLQVALDARRLRRLTIAELRKSGSS